jgi:leader peptidase (prepilin peptidase)/N-methyltransferase
MNFTTDGWAVPVAGLLIGLIAGSFLATLAIRWPAGGRVSAGRSRCDGCGATVPAWALVPLASYIWLGGRCGRCGGRIDWRHPALELVCGLIGLAALWVRPDGVGMTGALFGWMLATLALLDLDHFWLPDRLTMPLAGLGLLAGPAPVFDRLVGAVAGYAALALIAAGYRRARGRIGLGQGDAKLFAALGAWLGWRALPFVMLGACAIGLVWAIVTRKRGSDRLPLGTLLAVSGWGGWLVLATA